MSKKDIIPLINLYLDIYPEISDHIDLTNLEEKSNNELSEINKECLFLISGYGNEKLRKKEIIFLLVLLCV
ncbi:MAG: hypothetical protein KC414_14920, partial [Romboutsia sp.]|nr:hypothetical protein [Romboutsia sp.]